jgi:hypothetical protein
VLLTLALILLVLAVVGGIVFHPLLFLIAVLALVMMFSGHRGPRVGRRRGPVV